MLFRRLLTAIVAVAVVAAWPVLAATTNLYLPLVTRATAPAPTFVIATPSAKPGATTLPTRSSTPTNQPDTATLTPTATSRPSTSTPTVKPGATATPTSSPTATTKPEATNTPTPLPPSLQACQQDPNASNAPNYPVKITAIDKGRETVTLQNVSGSTIDLANWTMCSITGNQTHPIVGTLASGASATFNGPPGNIWNNSQQDDGALYDPNGSLVSYLACSTLQCP